MAKTQQDEVIKKEIIEMSQAIFNDEEEFKKFDPFSYDGSYELVQTAVSLYDKEQNFDNLSNKDFALLNQISGITVNLNTYKEKVYNNEVHLSQKSKDELFVKIQQVWKKSEEKNLIIMQKLKRQQSACLIWLQGLLKVLRSRMLNFCLCLSAVVQKT